MTVKELIEALSQYPEDAEVIAYQLNQFGYQIMDIWEDERKRIVLEIKIT